MPIAFQKWLIENQNLRYITTNLTTTELSNLLTTTANLQRQHQKHPFVDFL